jgi:DNA replication and repair protein RecF
MILKRISILNYKNVAQAELELSPKINGFVGSNGMGKTNLLDAVYYLSFCKSSTNPIDSQNILHDRDFFMIQGQYEREDGVEEEVYCGMKRRQKKHFKRNKKEYGRLADHIGLIPLIMVSPADSELISGGSEERRRFMDVLISQVDKGYLDALMRYNNALLQRNTLLKQEAEPDPELLSIWEEMMVTNGEVVYQKRAAFIQEFIPIFQSFYAYISKEGEEVSLVYESQLLTRNFAQSLRDHREKDRIMGYSLVGVHKDNLDMQLGGFPIKREGSQGQNKTYLIALKLAQFEFLKRTGSRTTPLLLLDDIFDKLDASRVEQIVKLVSGNSFGQIFITDTNREHLDRILERNDLHYKLFEVTQGEVVERRRSSELASAEEGGENHEME